MAGNKFNYKNNNGSNMNRGNNQKNNNGSNMNKVNNNNVKKDSWKDAILYTALGILLALAIKGCNDGDKTTEAVQDIKANVDTVKTERRLDADTIKVEVRETKKIVKRVEKKVEECCDCDDKQNVRNAAKQVRYVKDCCQEPKKEEPATCTYVGCWTRPRTR